MELEHSKENRRRFAGHFVVVFVLCFLVLPSLRGSGDDWPLTDRDRIKLDLVMQIVATCSSPEKYGPSEESKDGKRLDFWPITGGRFVGRGIRGTVEPGGADFPVVRPDGVEVVDALYRLRTDDGVIIVLHDFGLTYAGNAPGQERYRLTPEFIAPKGKYDWLNKSIFLATLTDVPRDAPQMHLAKGPNENDRLIQVYRVY